MKKLLNILSLITLVTIVSGNVIACGKEQIPTSNNSTDISTKIIGSIDLGKLTENTVISFKNKLQEKLKTLPGLSKINASCYDVYLAETTTNIQDIDITKNTSLKVKIVTKGIKFIGIVDDLTVNYIQYRKINLKMITVIDDPTKIEANIPNATTRVEIENALDIKIQAAVENEVASVIKNIDYKYEIKDEKDNEINTLDL